MNAQETVMQAIVARLQLAPSLVDGGAHRARRRPLPEGKAGQICVYFAGSVPQRTAIKGAPIDWLTAVRLECQKRGDATTSGDEAALALHAAAWERLMADPTLGGLLMGDLEPGAIVSDEDEADTQLGVAIGTVQGRHRTGAYTLEPLA